MLVKPLGVYICRQDWCCCCTRQAGSDSRTSGRHSHTPRVTQCSLEYSLLNIEWVLLIVMLPIHWHDVMLIPYPHFQLDHHTLAICVSANFEWLMPEPENNYRTNFARENTRSPLRRWLSTNIWFYFLPSLFRVHLCLACHPSWSPIRTTGR